MSTVELVVVISAFVVIAGVTSFCFGYTKGVKRGRDEQWVDDLMDSIKKDKRRRNALGQFQRKNQGHK